MTDKMFQIFFPQPEEAIPCEEPIKKDPATQLLRHALEGLRSNLYNPNEIELILSHIKILGSDNECNNKEYYLVAITHLFKHSTLSPASASASYKKVEWTEVNNFKRRALSVLLHFKLDKKVGDIVADEFKWLSHSTHIPDSYLQALTILCNL